MKNFLFILLALFCFGSIAFAKKNQQNSAPSHPNRTCISKIPSIEWENNFQQKISQFLVQQNNPASRINTNYTIPVIVHVVYWDASQNISKAQVDSQFAVLNRDYAGIGENISNCPTVFKPLISNTSISFCPAAKNPSGVTLTQAGIDRVDAQAMGFTNPATSDWDDIYIDGTVKPATIWDPAKYMNIWVVPCIWDAATSSCGILGYATFPENTGLTGISGSGTSTTDGVVIGYDFFGKGGATSSPYDLGRTASHEIGHWLGLRHIWGDASCGTDYCGDTPTSKNANYSCPTFPQVTCSNGPNGDMFMDFMDYTDDACMFMFTPNQVTRMQTAMSIGTYRASLSTSTVCNTTPQKPVADFSGTPTSVCPGSTVVFSDASGNVPTSWLWTFTGGTPATSPVRNPTVTYNTAGTYAVKLKVTNSLGADSLTKTAYITVAVQTGAALPLVQGFESSTFPPTGWSLVSLSGFNWERSTAASGFGTSTACMKFNNTDNDGASKKDDIISPALSISNVTNPRVKFEVAYAPFNDGVTWDSLEVLVKDICSGTTTSIYKKGGIQLSTAPAQTAEFFPSASQWRKDSVNIPATFLNKSVKVIFRNYGLYGHTIYVDNINIYGTSAATGTPTASLTSSDTTVCLGNSLTFTSTSTSSLGSLDSIRWTILGGTPSTGTTTPITSSFNAVGTIIITLRAYKSGNVSTATKSIRVKALPSVSVTSPSICSGQTAQPIASGATTYAWTGSLASVSNPTTPALTTTTTYTVTGTTNLCTGTAISSVTVNQLPATPVITKRNDSLICSVTNGISYKWYKTGTAGVFATTSTYKLKLTQNGTYTVEVVGANTCVSLVSASLSAVITGLKNNKFTIDYSIVPNPNNGSFEIRISSIANKIYQLKLYNTSGQTIFSDELNVRSGQNFKQINVAGIEKGVYFLSLISDEGISTQNIIIQ